MSICQWGLTEDLNLSWGPHKKQKNDFLIWISQQYSIWAPLIEILFVLINWLTNFQRVYNTRKIVYPVMLLSLCPYFLLHMAAHKHQVAVNMHTNTFWICVLQNMNNIKLHRVCVECLVLVHVTVESVVISDHFLKLGVAIVWILFYRDTTNFIENGHFGGRRWPHQRNFWWNDSFSPRPRWCPPRGVNGL